MPLGLVYKRSSSRDAKRYARTPGVVPNSGVAALAIMNPGRPPRRRSARGRGSSRSRWSSSKPFRGLVREPGGTWRIWGYYSSRREAFDSIPKRDPYSGRRLEQAVQEKGARSLERRAPRRTSRGARRTSRSRSSARRSRSGRRRRTSRSARRRISRRSSRGSRRRTSRNPYQWVEGVTDKRGRRRRRLPKRTTRSYKSQRAAETSGRPRATERSRLYIVDDLGNIICPVSKEKSMKRNRGRVRRNDRADDAAILAAAGLGGARTAVSRTKQRKTSRTSRSKSSRTSKPKARAKSKTSRRRRPSAKLSRRRIFLTGIPEIDRQLKAGRMPVMVTVPRKGKKGRPRTTAFASGRYTRSMRQLHKPVSKRRPRYRKHKAPVEVTWSSGEDFESMTKRELEEYAVSEGILLDSKLTKAQMVDFLESATGSRGTVGTGSEWTGGWVQANRGRRRRRSSGRRTSRRRSSRRTSRSSSRRRTSRRRSSGRRTTRGRRRTARRRTTRRSSRGRRTSRGRRRSSRSRTSRRRSSRSRTSRRVMGVRVLNNPRAIMPKRRKRGAKRAGHSLYQLVPLGPKTSKRRKSRSIPVLLAPQIVEYAEVRKITPPRRKKKKTSVAANRRRRRTSMKSNRRRRRTTRRNRTTANRRRRRTTRRNRTTANRRRRRSSRRRTRRNPTMGMGMAALKPRALWHDVGMPVLAGGGGFLAARALGSAAQNVSALQGAVGDPWSRAIGNAGGILATLLLSAKVRVVRQNRGPLVVGMGIALLDNIIQALGGEGGPLSFLSGSRDVYSAGLLGAYVDVAHAGAPYRGMMGEYVEYTPVSGMGAYVTTGQDQMMGEYVEQGVWGTDPIEGMIDQAEAQAAAGLYEAAAGVGEVYEAAAGVGAIYEALAGQGPWRSPTFGSQMTAFRRSDVPEVSTIQPPMPARPITQDLPTEIPITESLSTPEGRGHAGGIFAANLFAPMAAC